MAVVGGCEGAHGRANGYGASESVRISGLYGESGRSSALLVRFGVLRSAFARGWLNFIKAQCKFVERLERAAEERRGRWGDDSNLRMPTYVHTLLLRTGYSSTAKQMWTHSRPVSYRQRRVRQKK